ncbi:transmembrane protease serine 9-like isoform X2 [Phlebotomus papatasi]|uniref:transmembrane protease serine 9-like isoform X2 n=1 Tax=Phlebotomus papatasi TaxID=29031 RepID=UPI002483321C|nr:transmembrane protease serine 9-like isoform X2 [Phlebotomus papatasi]
MPLAIVLVTLCVILLPMASGKDPPRGGCFSESRTGRIVGGSDAERSEMPFIVSLTRRGGHFCGATILSEKWLVTAGHCLCNLNDFMKPSQIRAVLGLHRISEYKLTRDSQMEQKAKEVLLESVTIHPQYNCLRAANDIALLEMKPIEFSATIRPTCIAMDDETFDGTQAMVSGWGWTHENQSIGQRADTLQKASVEVWTNAQCQASFRAHEKSIGITENQLCAGKMGGGVDACWADSGGPLVSAEGLLIGIVSTGIGCARPELPGIYTRVTKYAKWIQQVIGT